MDNNIMAVVIMAVVFAVTVAIVLIVYCKLRQVQYVLRWSRTQEPIVHLETHNAFSTLKHAILRRMVLSNNKLQGKQNDRTEVREEDRSCCICLEQYVDDQGNPIIPDAPTSTRDVSVYDVMTRDGIPIEILHNYEVPWNEAQMEIIHMQPYVISAGIIGPYDVHNDVTQQRNTLDDLIPTGEVNNNELPDVAQSRDNDVTDPDVNHANIVVDDASHPDVIQDNFHNLPESSHDDRTRCHSSHIICTPSVENCNVDKNGRLVLGLLKCGHAFHFECIWKWMQSRPLCPVCRSVTRMNKKDIQAVSLTALFPDLDSGRNGADNSSGAGLVSTIEVGSPDVDNSPAEITRS